MQKLECPDGFVDFELITCLRLFQGLVLYAEARSVTSARWSCVSEWMNDNSEPRWRECKLAAGENVGHVAGWKNAPSINSASRPTC